MLFVVLVSIVLLLFCVVLVLPFFFLLCWELHARCLALVLTLRLGRSLCCLLMLQDFPRGPAVLRER